MSLGRRIQTVMFCVLCALARSGVAGEPQQSCEHIQRLMTWLPDETESLLVIKGVEPKVLIESGVDLESSRKPICIDAFSIVRNGKFAKRWTDSRVLLSAVAACRFQSPKVDRAWVQNAGCELVIFECDIRSDADKLLKNMTADADAILQIGEIRVVCFKETVNRHERMYYVAVPASQVLVVATDEQYLRELIARIDAPQARCFLHNDRLESEVSLHGDADVWAVRRYKNPLDLVPKGSVGFFFRIAEPKVATITFLTGGETEARSVHAFWTLLPPISTTPIVTQPERGVFIVRHSLQQEEQRGGFLLLLMIRLFS